MRPVNSSAPTTIYATQRVRLWYALLLVVGGIFTIRLFYLQVIRHDYYRQAALHSQLKEYEIPATRGTIAAHNGDQITPIVLNETRYTVFADPKYVKDAKTAGVAVAGIIGGSADEYEKAMKRDTRYSILAKKITPEQKAKLESLNLIGIGTREQDYRTYAQGSLASQLLGFVDDEGQGKYGIEQALNKNLEGVPGQLKAITDAAGVPLVANKDNVEIAPKAGDKVVLTIDLGLQRQLEDILKSGLDHAQSSSGGALIMDPNTGAIKAMANFPTYDPNEFYKVSDSSVFTNGVVSDALEVGSSMKPLTLAAALDSGAVTKDQTYYDPSHFTVDGHTITNIEEDGGPGTRSVADIIQLSLNTGATWLLMQMGGGQINQKARVTWHNYMVDHYQFGKPSGIEQGYESGGTIPDPNDGYGLNIQYANTAFGQGMSATPLQMGAALSSVINGGTYYAPRLVDQTTNSEGETTVKQPNSAHKGVVSAATSNTVRDIMVYSFSKNHLTYGMPNLRDAYMIGGKTGTAQIANPAGGYFENKYNGTFIGFVGGDKPQYVVVVRVNEPKIGGYAGSKAAAPIFVNLANMLIDSFGVTPKSH